MNQASTDHQPSKNKPFIVIGGLVVLALVVSILISSSNQEADNPPEETPSAGQEATTGNPTDETTVETPATPENDAETDEEDDQTATAPEDAPIPDGLPANWRQLTSREKTALNPFNCPADENGIIHLSAETGRCLEEQAGGNEGQETDDDQSDTGTTYSFGEAFAYNENSEIRADSLDCRILDSVKLPEGSTYLTMGQFLTKYGEAYQQYKTNPLLTFRQYPNAAERVRHFLYFEYLHNFEKYLRSERGSGSSNLKEQLAHYLECKVKLTLKNTGPDSAFSDGCRQWNSDKQISLIGKKRTYGSKNRDRLGPALVCTQAIVPFPSGQSDADTISFIVDADDQITEVRLQSPAATFRVLRD